MRLILGSSSQWRRSVMKQHFPEEDVSLMSPDIDEKAIRHPDPEVLPLLVARGKAAALLERIRGQETPAVLICCDQVVRYKGEIREKPESAEENRRFLESYATGPPETISAIVVHNTANAKQAEGIDVAAVHYRPIPADVIEKVIAKGETLTCAGGFVVEDPDLAVFIDHIDGTVDSIQGLPVALLRSLIEQVK
eukprot:TRINITY_DN8686_c0_g1_i1.p1 TRINITY_DN8686_c0_g1~~TRINITY_DN8686_c0_g1_i1.p1  ORF type:complete len:194 (-),score=32.61 TRINITY_DN8686_c0_g1_i1:9-590(-)